MRARLFVLSCWLLAGVLALGITPLAKKMALVNDANTVIVALTTAFVSAGFVFGYLIVRGKFGKLTKLSSQNWRAILLVGALGSGIVPLLGIIAMTETSASNRALFQSAYPVATAVAARFLLHERLGFWSYLLIGFVCIGLIMMNLKNSIEVSIMDWTFWLLLSTLPLIGLTDVSAKRALASISPEVIALGRTLGGLLILALLMPWAFNQAGDIDVPSWLWMLLAGACMGIFSIALYQIFDRTQATMAASLIALAPLLTLGLEVSLLGLSLNMLQWSGFILVLVAVMLLSRRV